MVGYLCTSFLTASHNELDDFKIILESTWKDLDTDIAQSQEFGGKWILIGSITFRKKAKEVVNLEKLYLHWTGKPLAHLLGSLYKKTTSHDFLPIQDYLVCDGKWNNAQQILMLDFEQKLTLGPTNTFYLVLTVPDNVENIVKEGSFDILDSYLPEPFKECLAQEKHSLALGKHETKVAVIN